MTRVFVYGSLLSGLSNHRLLEGAAFVSEGIADGGYTMVSLGGYPGVARGGTTAIFGEVYEVDDGTLVALDLLEGHPKFYCRQQVNVWVHGRYVEAWIYLMPMNRILRLIPDEQVESGDWRGFLAVREENEVRTEIRTRLQDDGEEEDR